MTIVSVGMSRRRQRRHGFSNPAELAEPQADVMFRWLAGSDLCWDLDERALIISGVEVFGENYAEVTQRDFTGGRLTLVVDGTGEVWRPSFGGSAMRVDDPLIETGLKVLHDKYAANVGLRKWATRTARWATSIWN